MSITGPHSPAAPTAPPASLLAGLRLPGEALGLLWRERSLWPWAGVPFLLSLAAFAAAVSLVAAHTAEIHAWVTDWLPVLGAERWYEWVWIGPLKLLWAALGALFFLAVAGVALVGAYLLASLLASPFHDLLSRRVEQIVTGTVREESRGLVRDALRALGQELRRLVFYLALTLPLLAAGLLLPGAQILTAPALLAFTVLFLPLDYSSYTLDRRGVSFAEKRRWLVAHARPVAGFGSAAFLTCLVPGLNFVAMPILVVAGTLLALRLRPAADVPEG